jgi:hypothetical protein
VSRSYWSGYGPWRSYLRRWKRRTDAQRRAPVLYWVPAPELVAAGAVPWQARAYQTMSNRQRLRWLRRHPLVARRVQPVRLDSATRRRYRIEPYGEPEPD